MPGSVNCTGTKVTNQQFLYLCTKSIVLISQSKAKNTKVKAIDFGKCSSPSESISATSNCCDMSHLVCAVARAAGIPARYVHGYCRFSSGLVCGHVWAQLWTGSKWEIADIVSDYNYLGYKTSTTLSTYNYYASLPF